MPRTVAALYVDPDGPYSKVEGVDLWPEARDARLYAGPHPVVAHPPCDRWSRMAPMHGNVGEDGGKFVCALDAVRRFGGVLEHPYGSFAWTAYGLKHPPTGGGWVSAGWDGGWTCHVEQGNYGHAAPKATWLYAIATNLPSLKWGPSRAQGRIQSMSSTDPRRRMTPEPFRDVLLAMARSVR